MPEPLRVLYAWEWGAGQSHLRRFVPIADRLLSEGAQITLALRDLTHARTLFPDSRIQLRQAPTNLRQSDNPVQDPRSLASVAWNLGYDQPNRIRSWLEAWLGILQDAHANSVIADFGLMPLVAARALGLKTIRLGVGYEMPPSVHPLAYFGPAESVDRLREQHLEDQLTLQLNTALTDLGFPPLASLSEILPSEGDTLLLTVEELDPYAYARTKPRYFGWWDAQQHPKPQWPRMVPRKAIAYLKPFLTLPQLFRALCAAGIEVALIPDGIPASMLAEIRQGMVKVQDGLVDFSTGAAESDIAITNANLGTTFNALLEGKPVLVCPTFIEQQLTASAIATSKVGIVIDPRRPDTFPSAIGELIDNPLYQVNARAFQRKYQSVRTTSLNLVLQEICERIKIFDSSRCDLPSQPSVPQGPILP